MMNISRTLRYGVAVATTLVICNLGWSRQHIPNGGCVFWKKCNDNSCDNPGGYCYYCDANLRQFACLVSGTGCDWWTEEDDCGVATEGTCSVNNICVPWLQQADPPTICDLINCSNS